MPTTYQEGAIDLNVIDINRVLVERTTTHIVLRGELGMSGNTRLCLHHLFDCITRSRGSLLHLLDVEFLGRTVLLGLTLYYHLLHLIVIKKLNEQRLLPLWASEHTLPALITNHRKAYFHRISAV